MPGTIPFFMRSERFGLWALLVVTAVWGTTFPAMKLLSAHLDALQIIWLRFALALLVLAPLWVGMRPKERLWGCALGLLLFVAFWLQIEGLARTSSNRNAFVTGLNVLVVPLIAMAVLGRRYGWRLWAACAMAFAGMALMFHENDPGIWAIRSRWPARCSMPSISRTGRMLTPHIAHPLRATRMAAAQATVMCVAATVLLLTRDGSMNWVQSGQPADAAGWRWFTWALWPAWW